MNSKIQFGIWMDSRQATVVGREEPGTGPFVVLGHVTDPGPDAHSNEKTTNNQEITLTHTYFKAIAAHMLNPDVVHVTGTGQVQREFIRFLADTPEYKNAVASESTSNKMSDEQLITFMEMKFDLAQVRQ